MPNNLEVAIDIDAPPERVWSVVSDLRRMPEFSPQCVRMMPLGAPAAGTWTLNLNRDGKKYWPTSSRIVAFDPNRAFAFRMNENRTTWSYLLEPTESGTRLTERREVAPSGIPGPVRKVIDIALGGEKAFEADLIRGMTQTLDRIKAAVERG
ncbi:SRPBCC family protein [Nocardia panacis]|uniref:SRPBCC family protein n=1 Tax=Nocardia panacis TaxID=2340916 RepID=A0A3A4K7V0_9NOCA|nr:SRPBCC family protein [Nocardia panacis]RJO77209.1 SRPBCC family protein [Nocardia panacis]